nr:MAG TPA: hypothetical protein [Caudoviricetes sp.]
MHFVHSICNLPIRANCKKLHRKCTFCTNAVKSRVCGLIWPGK